MGMPGEPGIPGADVSSFFKSSIHATFFNNNFVMYVAVKLNFQSSFKRVCALLVSFL